MKLHLTCALLVAAALATTAANAADGDHPKLDRHLAPIAAAAAIHAEGALRDAALARQALHGSSLLEPHWNGAGEVQVYLHYDPASNTPDLEQLSALGATEITPSPELRVIQAWVPARSLAAVANLPGVQRVSVPRYALTKRVASPQTVSRTGSVDTQGDGILGARSFRGATGINGAGIAVGVISGGDDHIGTSQSSGNLPANIWNDPKDKGGTGGFSPASSGDEGTAMMEIVYDLAPGVKQLGFCGPATSVDFITCLDDLKSGISANVIVDDLGFPGGAMFSTDDFTQGVEKFVNANPSIRLVTAAGNDGTAYWQGTWSPTAVTTNVNGVSYTQAQTFNSSGGAVPYLHIIANVGDTLGYIVEWGDSWSDSATTNDPNDYDVVVFDAPSSGTAVACNQGINVGPPSGSSICNQHNTSALNTPGPQPVQGSTWTASQADYYLEVFYKAGTPSKNIKILVFDQQAAQVLVDPATAGSIYGHSALPYPNEITVGAVDALATGLPLESFSSLGPVEFGTTNQASQSIMKPDFVAPDDVSISGAGGFENPFLGTSAAAPHIAGLVALLMSGYPGQSPYTLLRKAAGNTVQNGNFGFGLPNMETLLSEGLYPTPTVVIKSPTNNSTVNTGTKVTFTGSCTAHGSGSVAYDWNFGSSGIPDSKLASPSVTFSKAGSFVVTLTCTSGLVAGAAKITVTASAPSGGGTLGILSLLGLAAAALGRRRFMRR